MKNPNPYLIASAMLLITAVSCGKWLEGTSSSQVSDEKMFSSRNGFHEAVTGVYIAMTSADCYGRNYTFYANELSSVNYNPVENSVFKSWQQHSYDNVTTTAAIESMWKSGYFIISNANKILYELERRRDVITDDWEYNMLKGEMLAVRAYVHFDLMRMFGLESWDGDNAGKRTVPYVTAYSLESTEQKTYSETAEMLYADIEGALRCLENDPMRGVYPEDFDTVLNADGYWDNRRLHLNYYAVEALAARVAFWAGDYAAAQEKASDVVENAIGEGRAVEWIDADAEIKKTGNDSRDWSFSSEHLFSLDVNDLYSLTTGYCYGGTDVNMSLPSTDIENILFARSTSDGVNDGAEDIRGYALLLKYGGAGYYSYKLYSSSSMDEKYRNRMPMIRISEMYYIMAFSALDEDRTDVAEDCLRAVMSHRGYTDLAFDGSKESLRRALAYDVVREFLGEGQLFYWAKMAGRLGLSSMDRSVMEKSPENLMYPYPNSETTYGHVQEK